MKYLTPACFFTLLGACGITSAPAPSPETRTSLAEAERLLAGTSEVLPDPDGALLITDKILEKSPDLRKARVLAAEANAVLSQSRDSIKESLLADAAHHYERALAIDSRDYKSWLQLSWVYLQLSQFKEGRDAAHEAVTLSNLKGKEEECGDAMLAKANCALRVLLQTMQTHPREEGEDFSPKVIATAQSVLLDYRAAKQFRPGEAFLQSSYVYAYMDRRSDELNELEQGIHRAPDHFPLHARFRQLRAARGEQAQAAAFYRASLRDDGPNAAMSFALGQAQSALADKLRMDGDKNGAQKNYLGAITAFKAAMDNGPADWRDSCQTWLAIENLSLARINQTSGNLNAAQDYLKAAYRNTPKVLDKGEDGLPIIRDSEGSYYGLTLKNIGEALAAARTVEALRDSLDCWLAFIELHPGKIGWLHNNAAFAARDLGVGIEARGRRGDSSSREAIAKQAMELYEQSYSLYQVAVKLAPDNARIVNDCGLMLIYHLHRDYDQAREMFQRSIKLGEAAIAELPEDTSIELRHDAEETVGDAYQNLGKMDRDRGKPFEVYKGYLESAVKYFPYQRRESALWLRTKGVGRPNRATAQGKKTDPRIAEYKKIHAEAKKLADAQDYDGALLILDKAASKMVGVAAFHHDRGLYSFYYAKKAVTAGSSAGLIEGLFGDARSNLQKAVELDGEKMEPRLHLAQANYETGEYVNAAKISEALLGHISSRGGTSDELLAATHKVRAMAGNQVYVNAKMKRGDNPAELQAARNSFRSLEKMDQIDLDLRRKWSVLERWAGNNTEAYEIFSRALAKSPNDQAVLGAYVEGARAVKQSTAAAKALATRQDALGLWYRGMCDFYSAFEAADSDAEKRLAESISRLSTGIKSFEASAAANATYKDSCRQWIATCQGTQGFMTLDAKGQPDQKAALAFFEAAAVTAPDRATANISGNRSVKLGLQIVVDHYYRVERDFPTAIAILKTACAALPNDADLSNNLGLFARDYGSQVERRGKATEAKALFETSHDAYRNALRLEPGSLRQRNDLIVILLYHVKRDLDFAKATLLQCIEESPAVLESFEGTEKEQLDLQEAVGDCYENLGYYYWKFGKDITKARANLNKSLTFTPFKRRRGVLFLSQIDAEQSEKKKK